MSSKKRRRKEEKPTIHPKNKYSDNPPDFALLASLYPSFKPFVFYNRDGRPRIDWTDFNATRELTRVLLLNDHGLHWWIPDGQLCPTVPNRSNYIHWIEDLLSSDIIPRANGKGDVVRGFDIGTGANCIYPLLGASLLGWNFVASDVTDVALDWAERNVKNNPNISELIEIRKVKCSRTTLTPEGLNNGEPSYSEDVEGLPSFTLDRLSSEDKSYNGPAVLVDVVRDGETFDFCMCNPPFFESIEEAGLNPKTSCGGTYEEMVCHGGEKAFITRIIEDSVVLKQSFRWYTSMVGRKVNLKFLTSKLREVGVTIVKTTEFVQGKTCRWGLAWSYVPPVKKIITPHVTEKNILSFMLEGIQRQFSAIHILQSVESFFQAVGASCKLNATSFTVDITASSEDCNALLNNEVKHRDEASSCSNVEEAPSNLSFRVSVFQQIPGTLLVKGSLQNRDNPLSGLFSSIIQQLEASLRHKFCREKAGTNYI
ncbi:hypothetical protein F3Y22_tig00116962pilonHSYRG00474 [Hibiscus syriacus]|uniref:U6 small nuclear RNA (adenine-(43)-N(6))-methyltransferase n=1 Tax=Hibiscus syriacus TaxID=106335 RepID=A0A6A2WJ41_HIBSY|nr:RNA N6-adenosine-methyltransferase mettl16 [Hibiscus syriacus]KAE8659462.1 hypothetical protein F3Y22_tig00116962pilonHSYRG00474 [Hibiscus syriacus]